MPGQRTLSRLVLIALLALAGLALGAPATPPAWAAPAQPGPAGGHLEVELGRLLQSAAGAVLRRDLGYLSALLEPQAEVTVRGLGLERRTVGRQRVRQLYGPELDQAGGLSSLEVGPPVVEPLGPGKARVMARFVAYVSPEAMTGLAIPTQPMPLPGQMAGLVVHRGGHWFFQSLTVLLPGAQ